MRFLFIYILFFSINLFGQTAKEDTYCSPADFVGFCITFKKENLFDYSYWTCTGDIKGNGNFIKSKNKLTLNFTKPDTLQKSYVTILDTINSEKDSVILYFLIQEYIDNEPILFGNVVSYLNENKSSHTTTDMNGLAQIKLRKSNDIHSLKIVSIGYKTYTFNVKANSSKYINVKLADSDNNFVKNGTTWKYKIKKETSDILLLKKDKRSYTLLKQKE